MAALDQTILSLLQRWQIRSFIVGSVLTQMLLLVGGATRTWSTPSRFVAWVAYNMSDYMATTALGALAQAASTNSQPAYAMWAPMLLLHLAGPDNLCIYELGDAEQWRRLCLTFSLQLLTASYVTARSALLGPWSFTLLSVCLFVAAALKFAERVFAIKYATQAAVTQAAMPIYFYMLGEAGVRLGAEQGLGPGPRYYFVIRGEKEWYEVYQRRGESLIFEDFNDAAQRARPGLITLDDVLNSRFLNPRQEAGQGSSIALICISYAMYKMYTRRLSHLFMYEWRREKVKELLLGVHTLTNAAEVARMLDSELSFLFDSLYTKSARTAYSKLGIALRVGSAGLLVVTCVYVLRNRGGIEAEGGAQAKGITLLLLAAALGLEVYQVLRVLSSDWARVWAASTYCQLEAAGMSCRLPCSMRALLVLLAMSSRLPRIGYWRHRVGQYAMVRPALAAKDPNESLLRPDAKSLQGLPAQEFRLTVVERVLERCRELRGNARADVSAPFWFLRRYTDAQEAAVVWAVLGGNPGDHVIAMDLEHLVMNCHVATCLCELHLGNHGRIQSEDEKVGMRLSRYATYLLVRKTELLPCHAAIARKLATDTRRALHAALLAGVAGGGTRGGGCQLQETLMRNVLESAEGKNELRGGVKAARLLQGMGSEVQRWRLICSVWVDILVHIAYANRDPDAHLRELTRGGELLTHLWVLLGHLGYGQQ